MLLNSRLIVFVFLQLTLYLFSVNTLHAAPNYTLSGYLRDAESGELLPGVNVYVEELKSGTATNSYGFYSLTLPKGEYQLNFSSIGFQEYSRTVSLQADQSLSVDLQASTEKLQEIEISATKEELESRNPALGKIQLPIAHLQTTPTLLGEKDVMKVLQLMPGVQSGSEGFSGLYVRGGGPGQNLIMLDDAPVYNANHLFGFFSVFNGDAVKNVEMYKGSFPARYGGRLSSVIKMDLIDGNKYEYKARGQLGLLSASAVVEGPVQKGKSSFMISGRRTYLDFLAAPVVSRDQAGYYFYDLNAKFNVEAGPKDRLFVSGYFGRDSYYEREEDYQEGGNMAWGNATATLRWNHLFSPKLFSNTTLIMSSYQFGVENSFMQGTIPVHTEYTSGVLDLGGKIDFEYFPSAKLELRAGLKAMHHHFTPSALVYREGLDQVDEQIVLNSWENGIYGEADWEVAPSLTARAGLRLSNFIYNQKQYWRPEPRLSFAWRFIDNMALKASYTSMNQYIHMLSNTGASMPTDMWVSSTDRIPPQHARQWSLGVSRDFPENHFFVSLEGFYKDMDNILGYKAGSSFVDIGNPQTEQLSFEDNVTNGRGWAYGAEFLIQKKAGRLTGWLGYTLAMSRHQFDEVNFGEAYYPRYDRRHDLSLVGSYQLKKGVTLSANWVYGTGHMYSIATTSYNAIPIGLDHYGNPRDGFFPNPYGSHGKHYHDFFLNTSDLKKNNFRGEAYHRLDISIRLRKQKKHGVRIWEFGLYNAYNRKNPLYYEWGKREEEDGGLRNTLIRHSLFPILPSVSFRYEFGNKQT